MMKASPPRVQWLIDASCQLEPQLGLLARSFTHDFSVWSGLPHSIVFGFRQQMSQDTKERAKWKLYCLF